MSPTSCFHQLLSDCMTHVKMIIFLRRKDLYEVLTTVDWPSQLYRHTKCYNSLTHSGSLDKAKTRQQNRIRNSNAQTTFDSSICFVCQSTGNSKASRCLSANVAQEILALKTKGSSEVKIRLATYEDVNDILNKIHYHSNCLNSERRKFLTVATTKTEDKYSRVNSQH